MARRQWLLHRKYRTGLDWLDLEKAGRLVLATPPGSSPLFLYPPGSSSGLPFCVSLLRGGIWSGRRWWSAGFFHKCVQSVEAEPFVGLLAAALVTGQHQVTLLVHQVSPLAFDPVSSLGGYPGGRLEMEADLHFAVHCTLCSRSDHQDHCYGSRTWKALLKGCLRTPPHGPWPVGQAPLAQLCENLSRSAVRR